MKYEDRKKLLEESLDCDDAPGFSLAGNKKLSGVVRKKITESSKEESDPTEVEESCSKKESLEEKPLEEGSKKDPAKILKDFLNK